MLAASSRCMVVIQLGKVETDEAPSPARGPSLSWYLMTSPHRLYLGKEPIAAHPPEAQAEQSSRHRTTAILGWGEQHCCVAGGKSRVEHQ